MVLRRNRGVIMDKRKSEKKFWSVTEVAGYLGVSKSLVYDFVYKGRIPCIRMGSRILIPSHYVATLEV